MSDDQVHAGSARWWQARAARPRRNSALTAERIVSAAIRVLDAEGLDALTMRRIATELGTAPASLYRHYESRDAVLVGVLDAVIGELPSIEPSRETWEKQAANLARAMAAVLRQRPYLATIWQRTEQLGPGALKMREQALRIALSAGLPPAVAAVTYLTILHYVVGFSVLEQNLSFKTQADRDATEHYFRALPEDRYTAIRQLATELNQTTIEQEFEFGLQALIQAAPARARLDAAA